MSADEWLAAVEARAAAARVAYDNWDSTDAVESTTDLADMASDLADDSARLLAFAHAVLDLHFPCPLDDETCEECDAEWPCPTFLAAEQHLREPT